MLYVRRRRREEQHPHCEDSTVKYGGGNIIVWDCVEAQSVGVENAFICKGKQKSEKYIK